MNRVSQSVPFANDLKQSRTHVFAQDNAQKPQSEAVGMMPRISADAQRQVRLLGFFVVQTNAHAVTCVVNRRKFGKAPCVSELFKMTFDRLHYIFVPATPRDGNDRIGWTIL